MKALTQVSRIVFLLAVVMTWNSKAAAFGPDCTGQIDVWPGASCSEAIGTCLNSTNWTDCNDECWNGCFGTPINYDCSQTVQLEQCWAKAICECQHG
jgi:hypothetical protein